MSTPVFSLTSFRQWLETKPPEETYIFSDTDNCLAAQYFRLYGVPYQRHIPVAKRRGNFREQLEHIASHTPRTFGGALSRTITLQQEQAS